MAHQYYKILSLHGEKDILREDNFLGKIVEEDIEITENSIMDDSRFTHILQRCLDTDQLITVCKQLQLKDVHPAKLKDGRPIDSLFLGYSKALINVKLTQQSRRILYQNGFVYNNKKYVRYKRSANSAKDGKCLFILSELKDEMEKWSDCGLDFSQGSNSAITTWEAYISLTLSGIQETFSIPRKSILLIRDLESSFKTSGIDVFLDENHQLSSEFKKDIDISNKIWDGECLIDESLFDQLSSAFSDRHILLLRNRFFKSCGFKTKLQKWFQHNKVNDPRKLNGFTTAKKIEDIKIVITESSLKYLKFFQGDPKDEQYLKKGLQSWFMGLGNSQKITFGIVKSDQPSRYWGGRMVNTNYQLLNTLGLNEEESITLLEPTIDYLEKAKDNPLYFKHFLKHALSFSMSENDNKESTIDDLRKKDINLYYYKETFIEELLGLSNEAFQTKICKEIRNRRMGEIKKKIAKGRFLIPGTYATLFGNPIELLVSITTPNYNLPISPTAINIKVDNEEIQYPTLSDNEVYTTMFEDGIELCGARSPHITMGNLFLCKNNHLNNSEGKSFIREYFDLSPQIICVNSINHNLLQKLNGADFDSDTMLITNHPIIVAAIRRQRDLFPVPINRTEKNANSFSNESGRLEALIEIDNKIANNIIGKIVNLSQLLNSILWTRFPNLCVNNYKDNPFYKEDFISYTSDYLYFAICELEVLSNIEIDKAKRNHLENPEAEYLRLDNLLKAYQLNHRIDRFVMEKLPDYLLEIRNKNESSNIRNEPESIKWEGMEFKVEGVANHHTTLNYIYSHVKDKRISAKKTEVIPFSKLISPVDGKRSRVEIFNRLKIICAYFYIKIRSSNNLSKKSNEVPDYKECSEYVKECYQRVEEILQSAIDAEFVIFSIIKEIDDSIKDEDSPFIVKNLVKIIKTWKKKSDYAKSTELVQMTEVIIENSKRNKKTKRIIVDESYANLLLAALFNAKDKSNTYLLKEMIKRNRKTAVETLHYNASNGNDYIYGHRFERLRLL